MEKKHINRNDLKYIIHIPHSSLKVPGFFKEKLLVDIDYFEKENIFISDYMIDQFVPKKFPNIVKFEYSRMFCDVERYLDDSKEEMSKFGMGAVYQKDSNKREFINVDEKYRSFVIDNYYKVHHEQLNKMVKNILTIHNDCFIIDLHSFSDDFVYKMFNYTNNPDICIGINSDYNKNVLEFSINYFKECGYSVMVNYPYTGSIIPNNYPEVKSMMIEVNKRVYSGKDAYTKFYNRMLKYYDLLNNII